MAMVYSIVWSTLTARPGGEFVTGSLFNSVLPYRVIPYFRTPSIKDKGNYYKLPSFFILYHGYSYALEVPRSEHYVGRRHIIKRSRDRPTIGGDED
jgi:hypothetical protein